MNNDPGSSKSNRPAASAPAPGAEAQGTVFIDWGPSLPEAHGRPRILALVRDPKVFFATWEGGDLLRVRDLTDGSFREQSVGRIGTWYFEGIPEHEYEIELVAGGRTASVSGRLRLPRLDPAVEVDPAWTPTPGQEEVLRRLAGSREGAAREVERRRKIAGLPVSGPSRIS